MKPANHYSQVPQTERPMETFPQPRTIPEAWDTSSMMINDAETGFEDTNIADNNDRTGSDVWDTH